MNRDRMNLAGGDAQSLSGKLQSALFGRGKLVKSGNVGWIGADFQTRSSIRRSSSLRSLAYSKKSDVSQARAPWVPAPAKSTNSIAGDILTTTATAPQIQLDGPSSSTADSSPKIVSKKRISEPTLRTAKGTDSKMNSNSSQSLLHYETGPSNQLREQRHVKRPVTKVKNLKYGSRRTGFNYSTLQSKDSLTDVTTCLQERRREAMQLWQDTLQNDDPSFLAKIEAVNKLALEATQEVDLLRGTIQRLQKKTKGLSDKDCSKLNGLRDKVLSKVKEFEEAEKALTEIVAQKSASRASVLSATSKTSQTEVDPPLPGRLSVVSEKSEAQSNQSNVDTLFNSAQVPFVLAKPVPDTGVPSEENLNRLKLLIQENIAFPCPSFTDATANLTRSQSCSAGLNMIFASDIQQQRKIRFTQEQVVAQSDEESLPEVNEPQLSNDIYRQKISHLQRKLLNTEQEMEELKSDVERIESEASFRVRLLQNVVQEKLDNLNMIPDYLQTADVKLNEAVKMKMQLQRDLQEKEKILEEERNSVKGMKREMDELRERLKTAEKLNEFHALRNEELAKSNLQLRNEVDEARKLTIEMASQIQKQKEKEAASSSPRSPKISTAEVERLKLTCDELKDELGQSKRIIHAMKKSKTKLASDLNRRIEELLTMLQAAQHHKRILGDQIRYLKKSYNELFPCNCDSHACVPHKCASATEHKAANTSSASIFQPQPVQEPIIDSKKAWITGDGILIDNLLELPLDFFSMKPKDSSSDIGK